MAEKKVFHFRAAGGFSDTKMYHLAVQARKHAQNLAKDLGRVVRYYMTGGAHHSVKPPKANPCKRKRPAKADRRNPMTWKRTKYGSYTASTDRNTYKIAKGPDGWYLDTYSEALRSWVSKKGPITTLAAAKARVNPGKRKKAGKAQNKAAGLGDWVGVSGAKAVRVRRVKGATILDVKR